MARVRLLPLEEAWTEAEWKGHNENRRKKFLLPRPEEGDIEYSLWDLLRARNQLAGNSPSPLHRTNQPSTQNTPKETLVAEMWRNHMNGEEDAAMEALVAEMWRNHMKGEEDREISLKVNGQLRFRPPPGL
ncbi:unnamed protein product [Amoebophrya sp. A25]|nr:unnamed protein product [Amoebophrya sp. A25]|eukprot:GSA25T00006876001.1